MKSTSFERDQDVIVVVARENSCSHLTVLSRSSLNEENIEDEKEIVSFYFDLDGDLMMTIVVKERNIPRENIEIRMIRSETSKAEQFRIDGHFHFADRPFGKDHNPKDTVDLLRIDQKEFTGCVTLWPIVREVHELS